MEIKNILSFKKENIFDGAVQIDWFYDQNLRGTVASSYIFHGPKYFGLSNEDIQSNKHKLIDTASFIKKISEKVYLDDSSNRFMLTIAGYGAGKSHLGVTMASLFSGNDIEIKDRILENISTIDTDIYNELKHTINKSNLIITLNGMNNFNLNNEILKNAKKALQLHGQDDSVLQEISTSYITAENFVNNIYDSMCDRFVYYSSQTKKYRLFNKNNLKEKLIEGIYEDKEAFDIIDNVYKEVTGNNIRWDDGISANNILLKLNEHFCEKNKVFNKIVIIFDEFGRFLEYASASPNQAGDSALQQIFEAIQNANKNILFLGFIQSDLSAYISRVESPNIKRYVGRYDTSDKYYLSSNLETVLANLIHKEDPNRVIEGYIDRKYSNYHNNLHTSLSRWLKDVKDKSVWANKNLYTNVILKGCYPFHPITVWMLSNLSTWMQQRSTLNFAGEIFDEYKDKEIYEEGLTYIYPTEIIKSKIFRELYDAEEKGLQQSQYCLMYNDIMVKYGDKLQSNHIEILQGILIANICKFKVFDKNDYTSLLKYVTRLYDDEIVTTLKSLEDDFGIIRFDSESKTYDFITEGSGKNEFKNEFIRKKNQISKVRYLDIIDDKIKKDLDLDKNIDTSFGIENSITSMEWRFEKKLFHIDDLNEYTINSLIRDQESRSYITESKGILVYVYTDQESYMKVNELQNIILSKELDKYPIMFMLINDSENVIKNRLLDIKTLREFSISQKEKFAKFIPAYNNEFLRLAVNKFKALELEKQFITAEGINKQAGRLSSLCNCKFMNSYSKLVPFVFDGYEKTPVGKANGYLVSICRGLINNSITKKEGFLNLAKDEQNRAKSVLMIESNKSWKVMSSDYLLLEPQHTVLLEMYNEVVDKLGVNTIVTIESLFKKYLYPPYNMNMNSLALFISYFIGYNSNNLSLYSKTSKLKLADFTQEIFNKTKVDFKKILGYMIEYREGNKEERFIQLIDKINNNVYVENCDRYEKALNKLESEEEIPETLNAKISISKMRLKKGKDINTKIYEQLNSGQVIVREAKEGKISMMKLVRAYDKLTIFDSERLEMNYQYSEEYMEKAQACKLEIDNIIEGNAARYILSIKSNLPEKFYKNSAQYNQIVRYLDKIGKKEIAIKLKNRLINVEKEIDLVKKYEDTLAKFKNEFIQFEEALNNQKYEKLDSYINKINDWIKFFRSNEELTVDLREQNIEKLNNIRLKVGECLDSIESDIRILELDSKSVDSIDSIRSIKKEARTILEKVRDSKFENKVNNIIDLLEDVEHEISYINANKKNREVVLQKLADLEDKYKNTFLVKLISKNRYSIENDLNTLEDQFLMEIETNINLKLSSMNYSQCMENISKLSSLPSYTGIKSKEACNIIIKRLYDRINENKIETIIAMFDELNDKNKAICMELLKKYN
ncbi:MAG: hypothetical protein KIB00_00445 [Paeniclostridium sordellii]|nr:hypothetical protein [Paeniclostridium sordellii]